MPAPTVTAPTVTKPRLATRIGIVPVRLGSSRLPGKALLEESGQPLFVHTVRAAREASLLDELVVASDSEEVLASCEQHGIRGLRTSDAPRSGSERCAEALAQLPDAKIVIDVQGDWPEVDGEDLDRLVRSLDSGAAGIATLCCPLDHKGDFYDPHVVKVVRASNGQALYFSRAPIPGCKSPEEDAQGWTQARRHVGIYGFRRELLEGLQGQPSSSLEEREELEQLSWLHAGHKILVLDAAGRPRGIETRSDYDAFVRRIAAADSAKRNEGTERA